MILAVLTTREADANDARRLEFEGRLRIVRIDGVTCLDEISTDAGDRAIIGADVPRAVFHSLLDRCKAGRLADVRIFADSQIPDAEEIGYRARPWLRGIFLSGVVRGAEYPSVPPAPIIRIDGLAGALSDWEPPPVAFAEVSCEFPPKLQIQTTERCDSGCAYCPHGRSPDRTGRMEQALFERIVDECAAGRPDSLELYFHAEPLLDERLAEFSRQAKRACPSAHVAIITHEAPATARLLEPLADSGLDLVFVSANLPAPPEPGEIERRLDPLARAASVLKQAGKRLAVVTLANFLDEPTVEQFRKACRERGLPLELFRATTRNGDADVARFLRDRNPAPARMCERPFMKAYIRYNGDLVLCCEDWRYTRVMGNAMRESIPRIWTGEAYRSIRRDLLAGTADGPCARCDYVA